MAAPSIAATVASFAGQMAEIAAASAEMSVISTKTNVQIGADNNQKQTAASVMR